MAKGDPAPPAACGSGDDQEKSGRRHRTRQAAENKRGITVGPTIATYRKYWKLGTQQRLVLEFALETVSRRGEVVRLGPQHGYHDADGSRRIRIERTYGSEDVDIPVSDALAAAIDAMPKPQPVGGVLPLTYLYTEYGMPRSKKGLGNDFAAWARTAARRRCKTRQRMRRT
ncbi:hypothetical protein KIP88_30555 [Bradyrhizobium sp. SRL28]|uniref:hypothetical protein n=1 Tax=Bradyrhizobium sp. SRL28 TaxID=2836178 RepID=UPI001BDF66E1|nr:hypothetical protein [Bradyrhizobium sp. SRL28]MBT1514837.1 hypothetical protein [Bradyrhizobium sp. SRL28]